MIYLLVEDSQGYDDCDRPLFAHSEKEVVESVHDILMRCHQRLHTIAMRLQKELDKLYETNPIPEGPDLTKLPHRDLVWQGGQWNNAYMLEYLEEIDKNREKVSKLADEIIEQYGHAYELSEQDMKDIFHHTQAITYSIDEIEDDPDKI
jgi:hypothetical protein